MTTKGTTRKGSTGKPKKVKSFMPSNTVVAPPSKEKEEFLDNTTKLHEEQQKEQIKKDEAEKKIEQVKANIERQEQTKELQEKRQSRYTKRKTLTTIEETNIPQKYFVSGETRSALLYELNEELNIYCRKNKIRLNAQLSLIVYEFLRKEGHIVD